MAVHIRLQRHGATHRPFYHLVATDHRSARNGRFLEKLGYYDPTVNPSIVNLDAERVQYWYSQGAQMSTTAAKLAKIQGIALERAKTPSTKPAKEKKEKAAKPAKAKAPAAAATKSAKPTSTKSK